MSASKPVLAVTVGDPAGIGPEIVRAALADRAARAEAHLVAVGPGSLRPADVPLVERSQVRETRGVAWLDSGGPARWEMGRVQAVCGRAAIDALHAGHELALAGDVDALVNAPVSKEALHAAGEPVEGQSELLGRWCGVERFEMVAVAHKLRVMLLTRHMPLRSALQLVSEERVLERLRLFDEALRQWGVARPGIALAGLNPHAGERGLLGREELEILEPAVARARGEGLDVRGPVSPDAVFLAGLRGQHDGVLALYHDQAFIPIKLASPGKALTVLAGLPYVRVSPAHGTAFDIAGKGRASPENLIAALVQAAAWAAARAPKSPA
jgi:4-hydroxythreonine-4-phosphate dehydrogenase